MKPVATGLRHDVVEDTPAEPEMIREINKRSRDGQLKIARSATRKNSREEQQAGKRPQRCSRDE